MLRRKYEITRVHMSGEKANTGMLIAKILYIIKFIFLVVPLLLQLRKRENEFIQFEQVFMFPLSIFTRVFLRVKTIIDDFNLLTPDYTFLPKPLLALIDRIAVMSCDTIATASPLSLKYLTRQFPGKVIVHVPNGIKVIEEHSIDWQKSKTEKITSLFVGNMTFHQNREAVANLLRIADLLAGSSPNMKIEIVGGPLSHIRTLLHCQSVKSGFVRFRGFLSQEDLTDSYLKADIGLLPFFEDTPMVGGERTKALEYLKYGLIVLSGPEGIGNLKGLAPNDHYLVGHDMKSYAALLDRVSKSVDSYYPIGQRGRESAHKFYSWNETVKPLVRIARAFPQELNHDHAVSESNEEA
ncbi:MAG: glycosyltransferase [Candidatus Thorarchaeota archaeon]